MRRPTTLSRSALGSIVLLIVFGSNALLAQTCLPTNNMDQQPPQTVSDANCFPSGIQDAGNPISLLDYWPASEGDLNGHDILRHGIPLYVAAEDVDKYIVRCIWGESITESDLDKSDLTSYFYTVQVGNLPGLGSFEGAGQSGITWPYNAGLYRLPSGLVTDKKYKFEIHCTIDDEGCSGAYNDPNPLEVYWEISVILKLDCTVDMKIEFFEVPQSPPGPLTLMDGPCCDGGGTYRKGPAIKYDGELLYDAVIDADSFAFFHVRFSDEDYLRRSCDDNPEPNPCGEPDGTHNVDFETVCDSLEYEWSATWLPLPQPQYSGTFQNTAGERGVLWKPLYPGEYEICCTVRDRGGQAVDDDTRLAPLPFTVLVVAGTSSVETKAPFGTWQSIESCDSGGGQPGSPSIQVIRNDDDDDRDGEVDYSLPGPTLNENNLVGLRFTDETQDPNPSIRFTTGGNANSIALYSDPLRASPIDTANPIWMPFTGPIEIYVEGVTPHLSPNEAEVLAEISIQNGEYVFTKKVSVTVLGVALIEFSSAAEGDQNGKAVVAPWSTLPKLERPVGFEDAMRAQECHFLDSGADASVDSIGSDPFDLWSPSQRHIITTMVEITPKMEGVSVFVSSRDVDDNSYELHGVANAPSRDFLDPADRFSGQAHLEARNDNNDTVEVVDGGTTSDRSDGGVRVLDGTDPPSSHLELVTNQDGQVDLDFFVTLAPGDNFRVVASLERAEMVSTDALLTMVPQDFDLGGDEHYTEDVERKSAVCFLKDLNPRLAQTDALEVPETNDSVLTGDDGHHSLVSRLLTVRRRVFVESLRFDGAAPSTFNHAIDPALENNNSPITRYVTQISPANLGNDSEIFVGPKTGPLASPAADLRRRLRFDLFNPYVHPMDFMLPYEVPADATPGYAAPIGVLGFPPIIPGAFQNGHIALTPGNALADVAASSTASLYIAGGVHVPFELFIGGNWVSDPTWTFNFMEPLPGPPNEVRLGLDTLPVPMTTGTPIRVGLGGLVPAGAGPVPGEGVVARIYSRGEIVDQQFENFDPPSGTFPDWIELASSALINTGTGAIGSGMTFSAGGDKKTVYDPGVTAAYPITGPNLGRVGYRFELKQSGGQQIFFFGYDDTSPGSFIGIGCDSNVWFACRGTGATSYQTVNLLGLDPMGLNNWAEVSLSFSGDTMSATVDVNQQGPRSTQFSFSSWGGLREGQIGMLGNAASNCTWDNVEITDSLWVGAKILPATNGDHFRFPAFIYDDTAWELRNRPVSQSSLEIQAEQGGESMGLSNYLLRDTCVGVEQLPPPLSRSDFFWYHYPITNIDPLTYVDDLWGLHGGPLAESQLFGQLKLSNARCWVLSALEEVDASFREDLDDDGDGALFGFTWDAVPLIGFGAYLPWVMLHPWVDHDDLVDPEADWSGSIESVTYWELQRGKTFVHEMLHNAFEIASRDVLPTTAADPAFWDLYAGVIGMINPTDMHEIPGVTHYNDVHDPVANATLQGVNNTTPSAPVATSPYVVRYIKERLKILGGELRDLRDW